MLLIEALETAIKDNNHNNRATVADVYLTILELTSKEMINDTSNLKHIIKNTLPFVMKPQAKQYKSRSS